MTSWNPRANELFLKALGLGSADERRKYLDDACAGDAALRAEVEAMLEASARAGQFLESPAGNPVVTVDAPSVAERPGTMIGPYKLIQEIGEGGMGTVWMAQQTEPVKRLVALKFIRAGMDSRQVVARFEAERQALALMDHENIAKVLDGGTTGAGRPYFVMELVKGVPMTQFCDAHKLTPRQRLELFLPVCRAVQHAHQKGVIHRDLKPSNILVTRDDGRPVPKVIDFGVAKAAGQSLTDRTLVTGLGAIVGTLEYMSPEQAEVNQLDVDTRSDVYSLGVLLYELLTGGPPFSRKEKESAGLWEMLRVIREQEPATPSTKLGTSEDLPTLAANRGTEPAKLIKQVRGELDWIVTKCLEKDRNRRYESASALAQDVERHLKDEPVLACPPSVGYRLGKFLRRNKGPVLAGGVTMLALFGGVIGVAFGLTEAWKQGEVTSLWHQAKVAQGEAEAARDGLEKAKEKLSVFEYGRTMQVAHQEWRDNNFPATLALLDSTRAALRGWEYRYVHRLCHAELVTFRGHTDGVSSVSFSPDGSRVLTGSWDGSARVWNARTGAGIVTLRHHTGPHTGPLGSASFSPDGSRVVTCGDRTPRVWDAMTGVQLRSLNGHTGSVQKASFSADGSRVVTVSDDRTARVWDVESGISIRTLRGHTETVWSASFSPDGSRVVTTSEDRTARVWDVETGTDVHTLKHLENEHVNSASFSPDGSRVVTASSDRTARVWDAKTGVQLRTLRGHTDRVGPTSFSADGSRVVTCSLDRTARVWNVETGEQIATLQGHTQPVELASFSSDGSRVLTGGLDGTARVWDAETGAQILTIRHARVTTAVAFSPDGSRVLTAGPDWTAQLWDARTEIEARALTHSQAIRSASFSADGSRVVTSSDDRTARLWNAETGAEVRTLKHTGQVWSASFSRDGSRVVTASFDNASIGSTVRVWNARTGDEVHTLNHGTHVISASFSPDGSRLVTCSSDPTARLWNAENGVEIYTLRHSQPVYSASFSPDGSRLVTIGEDPSVRVWNAETGTEVFALQGHTGPVFKASFSPDGSRLVTASNDKTARVWDAETGAEVLTLKGHTGVIPAASFCPDGSRLVTGSSDRTARVWDAKTGAEVLTLKGHTSAVTTVSWSVDGSRVLTSGENFAKVWDATPVNREFLQPPAGPR